MSIEFVYDDASLRTESGSRLLDAILDAGIDHRHVCGGHGFCTSCRVEVIEGHGNLSPVSRLERDRLGGEAGTLRLACQTRIFGPVRIRVPTARSSRFSLEIED